VGAGVDSDGLFTVQEQEEMRDCIAGSELVLIASPDGHDGFLLEFRQVNDAVLAWLRRTLLEVYEAAPAADGGGDDGDLADEEGLKNRTTTVGEAWGDDGSVPADAPPVAAAAATTGGVPATDLLKW
jgi:homoserine O-acetyltransferase/O-succinyltransferase